MTARTHLALRLAAIVAILAAAMVPRGSATQGKAQLASLLAPTAAGAALARR